MAPGSPEHRFGLLSVLALRIGDTVAITVGAYRPGGPNSRAALRALVTQTLAEFDLTGVIDCQVG